MHVQQPITAGSPLLGSRGAPWLEMPCAALCFSLCAWAQGQEQSQDSFVLAIVHMESADASMWWMIHPASHNLQAQSNHAKPISHECMPKPAQAIAAYASYVSLPSMLNSIPWRLLTPCCHLPSSELKAPVRDSDANGHPRTMAAASPILMRCKSREHVRRWWGCCRCSSCLPPCCSSRAT